MDKPIKRQRPDSPHYVNNARLTTELSNWIKENEHIGKKHRELWSPMPNYVSESIIKLTERIGLKGNWRGYSYVDEMKSNAIYNVFLYCHNFDPSKSENAFSYLTQCINNAFRQTLKEEKAQADLKYQEISEHSAYNVDRINLYSEEE